ncbi:MAG: FliH/SctL family protein [Planctomycetota bacterium]
MAVIPRADAEALARDAIVLDLGDLSRQGEALLARAQAAATQIITDARAERDRLIEGAAERGHREGDARGYAEGLARGREEGSAAAVAEMREQVDAFTEAWTRALEGFESLRRAILGEARRDVLRFAALMGERVAKRQVELDPDLAAAQLDAALELVMRPSRVRVRVSPDGSAALQRALPALAARLDASTDVDVVVDEALSPGSVLVEADATRIDATIETQVQRIVDALLPARASDGGDGAADESEPPRESDAP